MCVLCSTGVGVLLGWVGDESGTDHRGRPVFCGPRWQTRLLAHRSALAAAYLLRALHASQYRWPPTLLSLALRPAWPALGGTVQSYTPS